MSKEETLIELFKEFSVSDLLGFARILDVPEIDPFEDFIVEIVIAFNKQNRVKKRQLLKLAKDIVKDNRAAIKAGQKI